MWGNSFRAPDAPETSPPAGGSGDRPPPGADARAGARGGLPGRPAGTAPRAVTSLQPPRPTKPQRGVWRHRGTDVSPKSVLVVGTKRTDLKSGRTGPKAGDSDIFSRTRVMRVVERAGGAEPASRAEPRGPRSQRAPRPPARPRGRGDSPAPAVCAPPPRARPPAEPACATRTTKGLGEPSVPRPHGPPWFALSTRPHFQGRGARAPPPFRGRPGACEMDRVDKIRPRRTPPAIVP